MNNLKTTFGKILRALLYILPAILFFSYHPIISLGSNTSMNFELSLPLIWLVIFDIVGFIALLFLPKIQAEQAKENPEKAKGPAHKKSSPKAQKLQALATRAKKSAWNIEIPGISDRKFFMLAWFPLFATISVAWSHNFLRGFLTAGIIWLVFFAVFVTIFVLPLFGKIDKTLLVKFIFGSTLAVCAFCLVQSALNICGINREDVLLCYGCSYRSFGFPHPSGFAIEPQFMGNLLLAPALLALYLWVLGHKDIKISRKWLGIFSAIFAVMIFFVYSRGAIFAYGIALIVMLVFAIKQKQTWGKILAVGAGGFLLALCMQGIFAQVGPTSETFSSAIAKSVHHLTLGKIDFRATGQGKEIIDTARDPKEAEEVEIGEPIVAEEPADQTEVEQASFSGYVPESTNERLVLNKVALKTWSSSVPRALFGVGLGGAGVTMYEEHAEDLGTPKQIVQNEPVSLLLEVGLIGIALILVGLWVAFANHEFWSQPALPLLLALILAYIVTMNFFSGLANALQIYLMPAVLWLLFQNQGKK